MLIRFSERNVSRPAGEGRPSHNGASFNRWWGYTKANDQPMPPHAKVVIVDYPYLYTPDPYKSSHPNEAAYHEVAKLIEAAL